MDVEIKKAVEKISSLAVEFTWSDDGGSYLDTAKFEREAEKVLRELFAKAEGFSRTETMQKWRLAGTLDLSDY